MKEKLKVIILLGAEFVAVAVILILIFLAGKKSYTVTFDLNGGILLGGDLEQRVTQGHDANPPETAKEGHYFLRWSTNYKKVTRDITVKAIWEYETTPGISYSESENANYCEIVGSYSDLRGDVYIGAYHDEKKVLGIKENAFANRTGITGMFLLDGIIRIEKNAFAGCSAMKTIDIPSTTVAIEGGAFAGCSALEELVLPKDLEIIGAGAFEGCTSIKEVVIPESVKIIEYGAFSGCISLERVVILGDVERIDMGAFDSAQTTFFVVAEEKPAEWSELWCAPDATVEWGYELPPEDEEDTEETDKNSDKAQN